MEEFEKAGIFYLGKNVTTQAYELYDSKDLTTHAVCVGMTGSGKTGLGITLLEEAALDKIPAIIIDPKGDVTNLLLSFPELRADDFLPWVDPADAERKGKSVQDFAADTAKTWKDGLASWGESSERIRNLKNAVDMVIYTPASNKGVPLSILNSFTAPPEDERSDMRDKIMSVTSSLLGLLGITADPIKSKEHILISTILNDAWQKGENVDIPTLIQAIQKPSFVKIGALDIDTFYPPKERMELSISLNNLLASPGFQAWMEGEPLDIQRLMYSKDGKPKLSIISIAHLSDSERMFFVTLLLNQLISWMRLQPGTSSLRALLYMDEIFGYFPPTAMPPSKLPMLTLLKQARAFGLGIVLVTQNPVDLDYKGLANCGTWFIGKLQTDRDKKKVIEGLNGDIDSAILDKTGNRTFILRSIYKKEPSLFQTRWTLSYLKGPLTLNQIALLTIKQPVTKQQPPAPIKPQAHPAVDEYYADRGAQNHYTPKVLVVAKLHYVDAKSKIDTWTTCKFAFDADLNWDTKEDVSNIALANQPKEDSSFEELPPSLMQEKTFSQYAKSIALKLYQNEMLHMYTAPDSALTSTWGESEGDFRAKAAINMRQKRDEEIKKLKAKYETKMSAIQEKMKKASSSVEDKQQKSWIGKTQAAISLGATLLGAFMGKKSLTRAESTLKSASRIAKQSQDVSRAEESYSDLEGQLKALQKQMDDEMPSITVDPQQIAIETISIAPKKSDIIIEKTALLWWPI